jgi:hypothetical protein
MAAARGRWIRFVDGDDVLDAGSTRRLLDLARGELVIAYGATAICDDALHLQHTMISTVEGAATEACLLGRFDVTLPSLLFPRSVVARAGEWEPTMAMSEDWDFVLRALEHAPVRGERAVATWYRRHAASATVSADIATGERAWARVLERFFERHPELRNTSLARRAEAARFIDKGLKYLAAADWRTGSERLLRALALDPASTARAVARVASGGARRRTGAAVRWVAAHLPFTDRTPTRIGK